MLLKVIVLWYKLSERVRLATLVVNWLRASNNFNMADFLPKHLCVSLYAV